MSRDVVVREKGSANRHVNDGKLNREISLLSSPRRKSLHTSKFTSSFKHHRAVYLTCGKFCVLCRLTLFLANSRLTAGLWNTVDIEPSQHALVLHFLAELS